MRPIAAVAAAVVLSACGMLPSALPEWVANREALASCGEEEYAYGQTNLEGRHCLLEAFRDGRDGELISTQRITDERTVTRYLRVHEDGTIEVFTDGTRDPLGSGAWQRETCGQMLGAEEVRDVWVGEVFVILDCDEQAVP